LNTADDDTNSLISHGPVFIALTADEQNKKTLLVAALGLDQPAICFWCLEKICDSEKWLAFTGLVYSIDY
jgi:hypothetical protein